jgi:predicted nucleotidyltransferase
MAAHPEQLARHLRRRFREQADVHRARAQRLLDEIGRLTGAAAAAGRIRRAWVIGSLARGDFGAHSDVDVVVEGLSASDWPRLWDEMCGALGVEVDLLRLEELPAPFRDRVTAEGTALHVS